MVLVGPPDVLMVEFLEEQIAHIFSLKVDFLLWAGSEQLCFPKAKGTFSSAEGQRCVGPMQSGWESRVARRQLWLRSGTPPGHVSRPVLPARAPREGTNVGPGRVLGAGPHSPWSRKEALMCQGTFFVFCFFFLREVRYLSFTMKYPIFKVLWSQ